MSKQVDKTMIRTMDKVLIALLIVGLVIVFIALVGYFTPDALISEDQGEEKVRNCFEQVDKILSSHGIDMMSGTIEEGDLFGDDGFEMKVSIDIEPNLRLEIGIHQFIRIPNYGVSLTRYGEVNAANEYLDLRDYPYVFEVAAYLGNIYSDEKLLRAVEKQQKSVIKLREKTGQTEYESKRFKRFFIPMEEVSFGYFTETADRQAYQNFLITDYLRV